MNQLEEKLDTILLEVSQIRKEINEIRKNRPKSEEEFVDTEHLCKKLKITKEAVRKYRFKKVIPFYKISGKVLFKMSEVINSLNYYNGSNRS